MAEQKKPDLKAMMAKLNELELDDLNNIDWENMGSWPLPGKIVFCVLLFVGVLVGGYFYLIADEMDNLARAQQKEIELKRDFENKAFRVANLDAYKAQLAEMEESFGTLLKQLPRDTEMPGLLDDITAAASTAGLKLGDIKPEALIPTEFYQEQPLNLEGTGGYHEMGAFVSAVAALPRIVTLHDFSIDRISDSSDLKIKIKAKTYQYRGDGAMPAKKTAGGTK